MPSATATVGSSGTGVTHTVIVAPTQGVLRYVPFTTNANVGDTVAFMWGANNHTVTQSSELAICNKTANASFASGEQNQGFEMTVLVNDTNPVFYYCGTATHCEKGMFGIINPPSTTNANNSVAGMMSDIVSNSSTLAAMSSYTNTQCANNSAAANWGSDIDMTQMPEWSQEYMVSNVLYTRAVIGSNPDIITTNGTVNLNTGAPLMIPKDLAAAATDAASNSSSGSTTSSTSAPSASASSAATTKKSNGARSLGSSGALVGVVVVVGAFLAL